MTTATSVHAHPDREAERVHMGEARPVPSTELPAWALLVPALAVALAVAAAWRRRLARRAARKPAVDWKLGSGNNISFSPRMDFHPTLNCGRRAR